MPPAQTSQRIDDDEQSDEDDIEYEEVELDEDPEPNSLDELARLLGI